MEQHLIDANNLGVGKANPGIFVCKEYAHGWNNALQAVVEAAPTVDPEALPIVRQLRAELDRVTAERDAAQRLLAEHSGVVGMEKVTTCFGCPIDKVLKLVTAYKEGRCKIIPR